MSESVSESSTIWACNRAPLKVAATGEGQPVFMNSPLTFSHCGLEVRIPRIAALYESIATKAMLVRWDLRNYGPGCSWLPAPVVGQEGVCRFGWTLGGRVLREQTEGSTLQRPLLYVNCR